MTTWRFWQLGILDQVKAYTMQISHDQHFQLQHSSIILPFRPTAETRSAASLVGMSSTAFFTASRTPAGILFEDI